MNRIPNLKLLSTVVLLPVMALAVLGTAFFFKDRVSFFSQAAPDTVVTISPKTANIAAKKNIEVTVLLNNKQAIKTTNIVVTFDKTYFNVVGDPKPNPLLGKIIKTTTAKEANKTGVIIVKTKLPKAKQAFKDGYLFKFTLRGKAATPNATKVELNTAQSTLKTAKGENIIDSSVARNASYVIHAANAAPVPVCDEITVNPTSGNAPMEVTASMVGIPSAAKKQLSYVFNFAGTNEAPITKNSAKHTYTTPGIYEVVGKVQDSGKTSEECSATVEVIDPADLTHNVCVNNACTEISGGGTDSCEVLDAACGDSTKHNVCQNNACVLVAGEGTDQCAPVGISCGTSSHNVCINDACVSVPGAGSSECPTVGGACGNSTAHNICENNACVSVAGAGTDQCAPIGGTCGLTGSHNECVNDACIRVSGTGSNQCATVGQACGSSTTHKECRNNSCTVINGAGTDACAVAGTSCNSSVSHKACLNSACTVVSGAGNDDCQTPGDTCQAPAAHLECRNNACTTVSGSGTNATGCTAAGQTCNTASTHLVCSNNSCTIVAGGGTNDAGCTSEGQACTTTTSHLVCTNNACTVVAGDGTNATGCTAAGQTCQSSDTPSTYLACVDSACKQVLGNGTNLDGCSSAGAQCKVAACPDPANPSCQDCDGNGVVNILDFSCFAKAFNQTL